MRLNSCSASGYDTLDTVFVVCKSIKSNLASLYTFFILMFYFCSRSYFVCQTSSGLPPRSGELRTQKFKCHLMRTQSLEVLFLKPGVGQYIAMHASLTARDFFFANFYPSRLVTCIFSPNPLVFFLCCTGSCTVLQNKIGHSAGCRFPC